MRNFFHQFNKQVVSTIWAQWQKNLLCLTGSKSSEDDKKLSFGKESEFDIVYKIKRNYQRVSSERLSERTNRKQVEWRRTMFQKSDVNTSIEYSQTQQILSLMYVTLFHSHRRNYPLECKKKENIPWSYNSCCYGNSF